MTGRSRYLIALLLPVAALGLVTAAATAQHPIGTTQARLTSHPAKDRFASEIAPLIRTYCLGCHSGSKPPAGIALNGFADTASVLKARDLWEKVARNIETGHMPPEGMPHPTAAQRDAIVSWLHATLSAADNGRPDPGHVTLRRLNRTEYNNTVRDLLGIDIHPADDFPADDTGYSFDNDADVLTISPLLMEQYLSAAEKIARAAIVTPESAGKSVQFKAEKLPGAVPIAFPGMTGHLFSTNGEIGVDYPFPQAGRYTFRARAFGQQAGSEPVKMGFLLDGKLFFTAEVKAVESAPAVYEAVGAVPAGKHHFAVSFLNDYYKPETPGHPAEDRNLIVDYLEIQPPPHVMPVVTESHRRIFFTPAPASKEVYARQLLARLARRAYRRPVSEAEVTRLMRYVHLAHQEGASFERGIQLALEAMLVSPHFLYHVEIDPRPNDPKASHLVDDFEMASRLSYFLWSSMPDEELFTLAAKGKLHDPKVLAAQARRMLQDPKARALSDDFAAQWLQLRKLDRIAPDPGRFPEYTDTLRQDMRTETEMFFDSVVRNDRSVLDFLDGRYSFLDERLARLYGIKGVEGDGFRRVALDGDQRSGILTQASILTVTSNPTRTSPVKRGKWVLEQILGTPPPPQPPNVGVLPDERGDAVLKGTLRQRMEEHRRNPQCASCHAMMDPIGFGLENYNAIGKWRATDGNLPIDSSGTLPDGRSFQGPAQLKAILLGKKDLFVRCLAEKLLSYGLGRDILPTDRPFLDAIVRKTAQSDYRFSALITAIVQSGPFRMRRGEGEKPS
ncbi:MAG TPA: DUF1592 domain-containing protein [Chthonomonadaceae bacterium]|nr:DUF1592 domain-containing protein [Chthonomonadaceae bacterium]